jgi:hypothetical protein
MESNRNQELGKCHKPKTETEWNKAKPRVGEMSQTENRNRMKSNRKPIQNGIKQKQRVEMFQTENRNRMESIRNQLLKGIKLKTEMEWNQTETKS